MCVCVCGFVCVCVCARVCICIYIGGIGLEDLILSPSVRDCYHAHKPLTAGCMAQDISDPSYRPMLTVVDANGTDVTVRPEDDEDNSRATQKEASQLISGLSLSPSLSLSFSLSFLVWSQYIHTYIHI